MKRKFIKGILTVALGLGVLGGISLSQNYITANASERVIAHGYINASALNVRSGEGTSYRVIGSLPRNHRVNILREGSSWDKVQFNSRTGYVCKAYLRNVTKEQSSVKVLGTATVTASALNVRSDNNTHCSIIGSLDRGSKVEIVQRLSGWCKIKYHDGYGYVSSSYLKEASTSVHKEESNKTESTRKARTTASYLNLREEQNTHCRVLASIPRGTVIDVYSSSHGWAKVKYNGRTGYVSTDYITYQNTNTTTSKPQAKPSESVDWVSKLNVAKHNNQLVTVQATGTRARVQYHKKDDNGKWHEIFSTEGFIGYGGLHDPNTRHEGDGTTPTGVYSFGQAFGVASNPGTEFSYHKLDNNDWWCADAHSDKFNTFQHRSSSNDDWSTRGGEHLISHPKAYEYAISLNFNTFDATPSRGSAIFLHCSKGGATAGCVAIPREDMIRILKDLDLSAKIVISTPNGIYNY